MSTENKIEEKEVATSAFDIFNTNVEDMTSYEEPEKYERKDFSKIFFEPDPKKAGKDLSYIIKLLPNIYNPKDNIPKRYTYNIPVPTRPDKKFMWISPSTIGKSCPVMSAYFEFKESTDARLQEISKSLTRKRYRACVIQIISSPSEPELTGQFRILKFPEGRELDQMIQKKMFPSEEDLELGLKGENVFDPFESPLMILRCKQGDNGRDFTASEWAEKDRNHGMIFFEYDESGLAIDPKNKKTILHAADRQNVEYQKKIIELLSADNISLKDNWMFKEPDADYLKKCNDSIELMRTGNITVSKSDDSDEEEHNDATETPVEKPSEKPVEKPSGTPSESAKSPASDAATDKAINDLFNDKK